MIRGKIPEKIKTSHISSFYLFWNMKDLRVELEDLKNYKYKWGININLFWNYINFKYIILTFLIKSKQALI